MRKKSTEKCFGVIVFSFIFFVFFVNYVLANERTLYQTVKVEEIERRGTEFLWKKISEEEENFEVAAKFHGIDITVPDGKIEYEFEIIGRNRLKSRVIPLVLNIKIDRKLQRKIWLTSEVKFFKEVLKTTRQLQRGAVITSKDIELTEVDALRVGQRTFVNPKEVIGLMMVRNIRRGNILKIEMVRKPAVVKRGDRVIITAKMGPMKITTPGIVKEKGFKGSMIRVQNIQSKKEVYARVIDSKTVEVNF